MEKLIEAASLLDTDINSGATSIEGDTRSLRRSDRGGDEARKRLSVNIEIRGRNISINCPTGKTMTGYHPAIKLMSRLTEKGSKYTG